MPYRLTRIVVAERFGVSPAAVDEWPAIDVADALSIGKAISEGSRQ